MAENIQISCNDSVSPFVLKEHADGATIARLRDELAACEMQLQEKEEALAEAETMYRTLIALKNSKIKSLEATLEREREDANLSDKHRKIDELIALSKCNASLLKHICNKVTDTRFRVKFGNMSNLSCQDHVFSYTRRFLSAEWAVRIIRREGYLDIRLIAENFPEGWSCFVYFSFSIISQKSDKVVLSKGENEPVAMYDATRTTWGYDSFLTIRDLMDDKKDFVKNDSILVEVKIKGYPSVRD